MIIHQTKFLQKPQKYSDDYNNVEYHLHFGIHWNQTIDYPKKYADDDKGYYD